MNSQNYEKNAKAATTAHIMYAYNPRQGARSKARYHVVLNQPLSAGRLHRKPGDALCKPREKFWGLAPGSKSPVTCPDCLTLAERHHVTVEA